jgi:hypothetical protein
LQSAKEIELLYGTTNSRLISEMLMANKIEEIESFIPANLPAEALAEMRLGERNLKNESNQELINFVLSFGQINTSFGSVSADLLFDNGKINNLPQKIKPFGAMGGGSSPSSGGGRGSGGSSGGRGRADFVGSRTSSSTRSTTERASAIGPSESPVWKGFANYRDSIKTNGLSGKNKQYYEWDYLHGDIEVYNANRKHLGSLDPITGEISKPPVKTRRLEL